MRPRDIYALRLKFFFNSKRFRHDGVELIKNLFVESLYLISLS